jgi:trimeric autotransporter adhesin
MKTVIPSVLITFAVVCFALVQNTQAVIPPPDGGYPGGNTAEGTKALLSQTTGGYNAAIGWSSLESLTTGSFNTGVGAGTLALNNADQNTATGAGALLFHATGNGNTANGALALFSDISGELNTAIGAFALFSNTGSPFPAGRFNTATGGTALLNNTGAGNTATGAQALQSNTTGNGNTAVGGNALVSNTSGNGNVALGSSAGGNQTTGSNNVYIGADIGGIAGESDACYIRSIFGQTSVNGVAVLINSNNKLGTITSSKRFKENIEPMDRASEVLFSLKPISFRYKKEIDPAGTSQFGLVAEDVEKVNPDLVVRDKQGKAYSVRYDAVNAMLLNEFLKAHRKMQELESKVGKQEATAAKQEATIAVQQKQIEALTAGLQNVSAQLEASKPAPQLVNNP